MEHKFKKKGCFILFLVFIVIFALIIGIMIVTFGKQLKSSTDAYSNFDYSSLDLTKIDDGTYTGSEDGGMVKVTVDVTIKNHAITNVSIVKHECGKGKPAEVIVDDIIENNSLTVDTVSGATYSSNVIKVAVYHALYPQMK